MKSIKSIFGYLFLTTLLFSFACNNSDSKNKTDAEPDSESTIVIPVSEFNPEEYDKYSDNNKWEKLTLPKKDNTEYTLVSDSDEPHIKAVSKNSASGWKYKVDIDPKEYPIIEWRWKIDGVLEEGDMTEKDGDDYAARIYITYEYDRKDLPLGERIKYGSMKTFTDFDIPLRSMNYVWANVADTGTVQENVYTNWVNMIAVESGDAKAGEWITSTANVYDTYKTAFEEEPRKITGVAIMTDSDNSKGSATAYYGDIVFKKASKKDSEEK
tara:strand:+ start:7815 stop:8621 length:807 start_codon:yes stop_codon:yes gene_type:complete